MKLIELLKNKDTIAYQIFDLLRFVAICLAIVIPLRIFIAQPFIVNGESMAPTFDTGEYLIIDQISYRVGEPQRGDVVVFKYPRNPQRFFIKRIIGLPGETISFAGQDITIVNDEHPEGFQLDEPYISYEVSHAGETTLSDDQYFVMGDNRPNSSDSRFWGPLDSEFIVGRAWVRLLPPKKLNFHPGDHRGMYENDTETEVSANDSV